MKKLLCVLLSCILVFNSLTVVYADEHGGLGGSFDPITRLQEEHPDWFDKNGHVKPAGSELFNHMIVKGILPSAAEEAIASLYGLIGDYTKNYDNSDDSGATVHYHDNGQPVTESNYNENNFYITYSPKFLNGLNDKLQGKIHALDGYYLYTPVYSNADALISYLTTNKDSYIYDKYYNGTKEEKSNIIAWLNALKQFPTCFYSGSNIATPLYSNEFY